MLLRQRYDGERYEYAARGTEHIRIIILNNGIKTAVRRERERGKKYRCDISYNTYYGVH